MNKRYNPERGIFIGKAKNYLLSGLVALAFLYPHIIQAATIFPDDQSLAVNASSIIATAALQSVDISPMPITQANVVWITAYASVPDETSDHPFITASGEHVKDGIIASNFLPFGTQVTIPSLFGNKVFTVEDRMNQRFSQRVDIWMPTVTAAINFGIQHAEIMILGSSPANPA
jgi:3D (Asp-Asp-Asp) domain-containing protein